jgi:catalase
VLVSKRKEPPTARLNGMAHLDAVERPVTTTDPVVRTKGGTAHGFFEVTEDISQLCLADFLQPGTRTPAFVRFSTVAGALRSADTVRDPRGFTVRFVTRQGNYDLVGNSTPVFYIDDPRKVVDFVRSRRTRTADNNTRWDFWTSYPESAHQVTILMTDRGIPRAWANMNGYSGRACLWENPSGLKFWVKYHWKTEQGIANLTDAEAKAMAVEDPDFHVRGLRTALGRREDPAWRLETQIMPFEEATDYRFNPLDLTKIWPHEDYPPVTVGRLVLTRNLADVELTTREPATSVPGIGPAPASLGGPYRHDDDFVQPGTLYRNVLSETDRDNLVTNIADHLRDGVRSDVLVRALAYWSTVDVDLGARVARAVL